MPAGDLIAALAWHVLQPCGTFSASLAMQKGIRMSDSALSERRQSLGTGPWLEALDAVFSKAASYSDDPRLTFGGFRIVGVDGTTFNCANTPPLKATALKTRTRRGTAAFFRISCVALCELGAHRPLAVRIGQHEESEAHLATQVVERLTEDDLLVADRYYGSGKWVARLSSLPSAPMFLLRVQERLGAITQKKLRDGSRLVLVKDPQTKALLTVREIKARVRRPGKKWTLVRFWTNLLDESRFPARDLVSLYAMRWEQEVAFREIKLHLHGQPILSSHTLPTAVQEICALFMAQAIVVEARMKTSTGQNIPVLEVSFQKTLATCRNLCWLWGVAGNEIGGELWMRIVKRAEQELVWQASKPRRSRSCPRKVRQPIKKWPRLLKNQYERGKFESRIRKS